MSIFYGQQGVSELLAMDLIDDIVPIVVVFVGSGGGGNGGGGGEHWHLG